MSCIGFTHYNIVDTPFSDTYLEFSRKISKEKGNIFNDRSRWLKFGGNTPHAVLPYERSDAEDCLWAPSRQDELDRNLDQQSASAAAAKA